MSDTLIHDTNEARTQALMEYARRENTGAYVQHADGSDYTEPFIRVSGGDVHAFIDDDGRLHISVWTDDMRWPITRPDGTLPIVVDVEGNRVWADTDAQPTLTPASSTHDVKAAADLVAEYDAWERTATADLAEMAKRAEETCNYNAYDSQRFDYAEEAWGRLGGLAEAVRREQEQTVRLMGSLAKMAEMLGSYTAETGVHFSCSEADVIAEVLYRSGHPAAAAWWLGIHASDDEPADTEGTGDKHAFLRDGGEYADSFHMGAALTYVESTFGA
ncbi:hypothetical protein ACIBTV_25440 [Micromonospora sp. NPDC049366]|uniref:hypothetical protein n=1 Tax=Micromonospora sp. NPDC049366 TaxID=3364271 RepID=UPI0037B507E3